MALIATVSGTTSNSYALEVDATAYFDDSLDAAAWTAITTKAPALITATSFLELMFYNGTKTVSTQALNHPRTALFDQYGTSIDSAIVAPQIKQACYLLALYMAENPDAFSVKGYTKKIKVDVIEIEKEVAPFGKYQSLPERVKALIDPFLVNGGGSASLTLS
jgi:hypothetical protein